MIFVGRAFSGDGRSFTATPPALGTVTEVKISNGIYNDVHITRDTDDNSPTIPSWDFDTIMYAKFQGNLMAGNFTYQYEEISEIRIKRRRQDEFEWNTFEVIKTAKPEDFNFVWYDRYAAAKTVYEYALVPVLSGVEGDMSTNSIKVEFDGLFIVDAEHIFGTMVEAYIGTVRKSGNITAVATLGRKYPVVSKYGETDYYAGSFSGVFVEIDYTTCTFLFDESFRLREELMTNLMNGQPKILKYDDGRMWMIAIAGEPYEDTEQDTYQVTTTAEWVEVGDANDVDDLYDNNFIDYDNRLNP